MNEAVFYALASVLLVSFVSFAGLFTLGVGKGRLHRILIYLVSFSAGAMLGDAFLHLIPEFAAGGFSLLNGLFILSGVLVFFIVEKFIHWRHCHHPGEGHEHPFVLINLVGDGVHNFIDGLIVGASYLVSFPVGFATTIAVFFHEIPQEIGDFGVLLHGGFSRAKALLFNFLTALTAVLGAGVALFLGSIEGFLGFLAPFAAGSFIYIAGADLIPELHKEVEVKRSFFQFLFFVFGILIMLMLRFWEF